MSAAGDDALATAKAALRTRLRDVRRAIADDPDDRRARSDRIGAALLDTLTAGDRVVRRVMLFDSLATEPDAAGWREVLVERRVGVFVPAVDGADLRVQPGDLDPVDLDAVVVPGLGFTVDGRRLGQGGGHYDRFLPRLAPGCLTIGVCFAEQVLDDLPTAPHDRRVDVVVTDAPPG